MNALIFAAGLGTRLGEISKNKPKALVEVGGKPMLLHAIEKLVSSGAKRIVINVHHHAQTIIDYVATLAFDSCELVISDESEALLETGGGLLKAAPLFIPDEPIILHNADVLCAADLKEMYSYHQSHQGLATLMVRQRTSSRYFQFDENQRLCGWINTKSGEEIILKKNIKKTQLAFSGIHIVDYSIIHLLGQIRKFSITQGYLDLAKEHPIYGWEDTSAYWFDIGTPEKWETANNYINNKHH